MSNGVIRPQMAQETPSNNKTTQHKAAGLWGNSERWRRKEWTSGDLQLAFS